MTTAFRKLNHLFLLAVGFFAAAGLLSLTQGHPVQAQSPGVTLAALAAQVDSLKAQVAALQAKTAPLSVTGKTLTITAVNVSLVDGTGNTNSTSGLGNLIIGYNSAQGGGRDKRTGSHNLILGDANNYTSYGGLVAGVYGTTSGPYAFVSGYGNTASSTAASASGGINNTASGNYASVSGGVGNTASGTSASVSGGANLTQNNANGWSAGSLSGTAVSGNFRSP